MRILIACEMSGVVREAFARIRCNRESKHLVVSCDLMETEQKCSKPNAFHVVGDVRDVLSEGGWDMLIAFPPCTHLAGSGARWFKDKVEVQKEAKEFFMEMVNARVEKICVENPVGIMSTEYRKPDQYIQPYEYGHGETKKTCLWLRGLPKLVPTDIVSGREQRVWRMGPSPTRSIERSRTYEGVAKAMSEQWNF